MLQSRRYNWTDVKDDESLNLSLDQIKVYYAEPPYLKKEITGLGVLASNRSQHICIECLDL